MKKVLIVDYDVHAGNGTSDIFYYDPTVLFVDLHQDPRTLFPGTGFIEQVGADEGFGHIVNIPLPPGTSDETYLNAFDEIVEPLASEFKPDIILANGGGDAHFTDSLGDLNLTADGFFRLSKKLSKISEKVCGGRLILMLASGYNKFLPLCWYALICGMTEIESIPVKEPFNPGQEPSINRKIVERTLSDLKSILKEVWSCFR
jgi:acetoin utilization protein AcuC